MKIHAYRLEADGPTPASELLQRVGALALGERYFPGDGNTLRLEDVQLRGDFLLTNFSALRKGHGPGRLSRHGLMAEFDLNEDEDFGEDTAAVIHVPSGYTAVQYNHYGPRHASVDKYLAAADEALRGALPRTDYVMAMCLRGGAYDRLRRYGFIQEVDFAIALPGIEAGAADRGMSVGNALRAPLPEGAASIAMQIRGRPGEALGQRDAMELVDSLLARGNDLLRAKVWGKPEQGAGRKKPIDLLAEHLQVDRELRRTRGQRFALHERWDLLGNTLDQWLASNELNR